jgi:hypothetical protein
MKSKDIMAKFETGCCSKFNPKPWDKKTIKYNKKKFVKARIRSFFHIPLTIGSVMKRVTKHMDEVDALSPKEFVGLFDENSLWGADVYVASMKKVPKEENTTITGTFLTKVYEGPYRDMGKWIKDMEAYVAKKKKKIKKMYFYYTVCPKCAKHYGENYVVIFAQI